MMKDRSFGLSCSAVVLIAVLVGIVSAPLVAQTVTGSIEGHVTDQTGAVVAGATLSVRNTETGQERTVTTNSEGYYRASFLPIGPYRVAASFTGFASLVQEGVQINLNQTTVTDFSLRPAGTSAEVTVTDSAAPINLTDAQVKQSLNSQEILDKPTLNPGSFLTLAETFTGFQENPTSGQNNPTLSSGSSINFNGTGTRGATFQINGVNNDDSSENQNRQGASLSTIKEFQVITNNYRRVWAGLWSRRSGPNQVGHKPCPRRRIRVPSGQRTKGEELLHAGHCQEAGRPAQPVRVHGWFADHQRQVLLV